MKPGLCEGCPLYETGEGYTVGEGPEDASVLLLGEALGAEEAKRKRPFIGGAGRVLNYLLQKAGIRRSELYITNVVRCRPPGNRTPTDTETDECTKRHALREFLCTFNLVVPLGNIALQAVTGKSKITKWRGSVFQAEEGFKVLATFHPAAVMRQQDLIPVVISDLFKIASESWSRDFKAPKQDYQTHASLGDLQLFKGAFAFDVETTSLAPSEESITLLGLSNEAGTAFVFDNVRGLLEREPLQDLFSSAHLKIGHNVMFDVQHLEANGIPVKPPLFDTMIANHLVLSDVPNDLAFVASLYTNLPYWKDLMKKDLRWYNATDVDATYRVYQHLSYEMDVKGMQRVFDTSMRVLPIFEKMRSVGVRVNQPLQLRWKVALLKQIEQLEKAVIAASGDPSFNWKSHKQLTTFLYNKLRLPRQHSKHGAVTANEEALKELYELVPNKIVKALLSLRRLSKLESTYFTPPETRDGRVHSEYTLHVAANGRSSSRDPNLQNVPKGPARAIYIPDDGKVFVAADYNQIELRVAAWVAQEVELLAAFDRGEDVHKLTAAKVYHVRISDVTDEQRHRAKFIVYGLGYGRGARSIAREHKKTVAEVDRFIAEYFAQFPRIKLARQAQLREADRTGYLANPFGRRRYFFGPQIATKVYNFIPSSVAADVLFESLVLLDEQTPEDTRLVLQVHDDVVAECPEDKVPEVTTWLKDVMERPIDVLDGYRFPVEIRTGKTWEELK